MSSLHGAKHHDRNAQITAFMLWFGGTQVILWTLLLIGAFVDPWLRTVFQKVYWVSILSLYANWATALGIVAGAWAARAAGQAHEDVEHTRAQLSVDLNSIEDDLDRLAALPPGLEARQLARRIHRNLGG